MQNFRALAKAVWFPHDFQIWQDFLQKHHFLVIFHIKLFWIHGNWIKMTRLVKNICWYINFFHFSKYFCNRINFSKHFNIFKFKICLNLLSSFFIQIHVVAKQFEPVLWNFAWQNGRSRAFRKNKAEFFNINTLCTIKVSFVTVVTDGRVLCTAVNVLDNKSHV